MRINIIDYQYIKNMISNNHQIKIDHQYIKRLHQNTNKTT
jgi:hypothetical protein